MKPYQIPCGKKTITLQISDGIPVEWVGSRKMVPVPDVRRAVEEVSFKIMTQPLGGEGKGTDKHDRLFPCRVTSDRSRETL